MLLHAHTHSMHQENYDVFVLSSITHYDIWSTVPLEDKISYAYLSKKVGLPVSRVHRIPRHAMTRRTFYEVSPGPVAHTANSAAATNYPSLSIWIGHNVDEVARGLSWLSDTLE